MRVAVAQHLLRTHERMELAALLSVTERAADEGAQVLAYPCVPGLGNNPALMEAFIGNVAERAPGLSIIAPCAGTGQGEGLPVTVSPLGPTLVLAGDRCIDPERFEEIAGLGLSVLVWQVDSESDLEAEAILELALDASVSLAPLVIVAAYTGSGRGLASHGTSALVHMGEILEEAGGSEDLLVADVPTPLRRPDGRPSLPVPPPVLAQRLALHRGERPPATHPSETP